MLASVKGKASPAGLACRKLRRHERPERPASVRPPLTFAVRGGRLTGDRVEGFERRPIDQRV
ncbi:hypothetical protein X755_06790 [Mesorhizobium sp. LNJC405B00]|nr:hypothetical protein X755_06790 [Mesorhizobium sp. LNJC405B00]